MVEFQVELSSREAEEYVADVGKKISDTKKPLAESAEYMVGSIKRNFYEQGRPTKWQKLSPLTIALRREGKGGGYPQILRDTGTLMNSITGEVRDDNTAIAGTNLSYAPLQQFGGLTKTPEMTIVPKRKKALKFMYMGKTVFAKRVHIPSRAAWIPPRIFVCFQIPEDIDRIHRIFESHVDEAIK